MSGNKRTRVLINKVENDPRDAVEAMMGALAPKTFGGAKVLVKPNMVGPSAPELGHTTHPELVRAVVRSCLDRGANVLVGDNPGGINRSSRKVADVTGLLDASEGCFTPISERVVEKTGRHTKLAMVISRAVLEADYIINLPVFKTHLLTMISGALKNTFGYVAGACKARLHLEARTRETFAGAICDVHQIRPPDLHIVDAVTVIEGNGPCHGGRLRKVGRLLASEDPVAVDAVMARMMGVDPADLPVQKEALSRGMGVLTTDEIEIQGRFEPIPDFKMPVTYRPRVDRTEIREQINKLYPQGMMEIRTGIKPVQDEEKCVLCKDCETNCPAEAIVLEPDFGISDKCIACYCCVELCPEGALEVPDVEAFRYY